MKKIFLDCGAHCGESILEAKKRYGNDIKIISFKDKDQWELCPKYNIGRK